MADAVSGSVSTPIPSFFISSPDDAVNVMDAVQVSLTDNIRNAIQQNVSAVSRLVDALGKISNGGYVLSKRLTGAVVPVTVASLESTPKTTTALQSLFVADGPMLGANLQEANETYNLLASLGSPIDAPVITPVLIVVDNVDGKPPTKTFAWYGAAQLADVQKLSSSQTSAYPGSKTYVESTKNGSGKVTQTVSYTTFDSYANRRASPTVLFNNLSMLLSLAAAVQAQLESELANAAKQADKLEDVVDDNRTAVKDEASTVGQRRTERDEQLAEALRLLRVLKAEREELRARARSKAGEKGEAGADVEHGLRLGQVVADAVRAIGEGAAIPAGGGISWPRLWAKERRVRFEQRGSSHNPTPGRKLFCAEHELACSGTVNRNRRQT